MRIRGVMKNYYREKVGRQPSTSGIPRLQVSFPSGPPLLRTVFLESVLFHAILFLGLGLALLWNREPPRSFRTLDPENRNFAILEKKFHKGMDHIRVFLHQPQSKPAQGGEK